MDKSDYEIYDDFMNIEIDGYYLDEKLDELYPNNLYKGMIPTLLFAMEIKEERDVVWNRIKPATNSTSICPILMCPDDCDFSCTIIVVEIENKKDHTVWRKLGLNKIVPREAIEIGTEVEWFENIGPFQFSFNDYKKFLLDFKKAYTIDESKYEVSDR